MFKALRRAYTDSATCLLEKNEIAERLHRSRKGFLEVANQSPIEISLASCLLNMHKRLAATEFDREEVT